MATVTPRPQARRSLDESHRRVRHPLQKLRGYIRFYVSIEGVTLLLSMLAIWFWGSLLLDYESFALFHLDWAQAMPAYVRSLVLGMVFAGAAALITAGIFLPLGRLLGVVAAAIGAVLGLGIGWWVGGLITAALVAVFGALVVGGLVMTVVAAVTLLTRGWWYGAVGLPLLFFYLADWFGLGLLVAYGWLGPWTTALAMVVVLLLGPVVAVELKRMLVDFRDSALALVLERRYPKQLGDRLITAVELANLREAARWGYSPAMIEQTIHDAADRVEPLPVQQVFAWKRLVAQGVCVVVLTAGVYALVAAGFCAVDSARKREVSLAGMGRLHDTMGIWFERNVLLENTPWPRRAHLELVDFPESGEIRMPENTQPPVILVRAYKWVVADRTSSFGWRPLRWGDLTPELLGGPVPAGAVPDEWWPAEGAAALTLDDIEARLDLAQSHLTLPAESHKPLRDTLEQLQVQAARPAMSRKLRMLAIPEKVVAFYWGRDTRGLVDPNREPGNLFKVSFPVLKEPVNFRVKGEDFYTPTKHIETVAPPRLTDLYRDEYRPAYLHYRLPRGEDPVRVLKGKKQLKENIGVSLHGSETSRFDVAIGTDVVLIGKSDKPLKSVAVKRREAASMAFADPPVTLVNPDADGHSTTFQVRFDNVRPLKDRVPGKPAVYDFDVEFTDTDNVKSHRNVVIKPVEDSPPTASLEITAVRKSPKGPYLITPRAYVPFQGKMSDEQGLDRINYVYTLAPEEKEAEQGGKALLFLSGLGLMVAGPPHEALVAAALASLTGDKKADTSGEIRQLPVTSFEADLARRREDFLALPEILQRLGETPEQTAQRWKAAGTRLELSEVRERLRDQPPQRPLPKDYELKAEEGYTPFDLEDLPRRGDDRLKISQTPGVQPRYQMQVWVEALDNDIETGPNRGRSKDTFNFLIVSEEELRLEIFKEEEDLKLRMKEVFELLRGPGSVEDKLVKVMSDLADPGLKPDANPGGFGGLITQANLRRKDVDECLAKSLAVHRDYQRILRELQVNRVQASKIDQVEKKIIEPLGRILRGDRVKVVGQPEEKEVGFPPASQALAKLAQGMSASLDEFNNKMATPDVPRMLRQARDDAAAARERVKELADAIELLLKDMEQIVDYDEVLKRAIKLLERVTDQQQALARWEKWLKDDILKRLLEEPAKPEGKKP